MHCMQQKSNGIKFISPNNDSQFQHIMTGFVDDTTHWLNNFNAAINGNYTKYEMYMTTQQTSQWWEQLLYATGGKLELQKCFYYPIVWKFDEEGIPTLCENDDTRQVTIISSETGKTVTIKKKQAHESHKIGILENPSGNYDDEYQSLLQLSTRWKNKIVHQYLTQQETRLFYQSFYVPSIRYHLTVGTYTSSQLERIKHPIIQLILSKMGYNSKKKFEL